LRLRQLAPPALVILEIAALILSPWWPILLLLPMLYFSLLIAVAIVAALVKLRPALLFTAPVFWLMHHAWGIGFISGICQQTFNRGSR
jgi:hypothetical protein